MQWITSNHELLGLIPTFLSEDDPRPAREQFDEAYRHGGGWQPFKGHRFDPDDMSIQYPGDPPLRPVGMTELREEIIVVYEHAWVLIRQQDSSYEVARMD